MDYRYDIPTYADASNGELNVVVEIPKGSYNKYEVDEKTGDKLTIVRTLKKGFLGLFRDYRYIYNYGFIPSTLAEDKDQLDAIVIADEPIDPLTVIKCKAVAVVHTIDCGECDDKIIVVPVYSNKKSFNLKRIMRYLKNYKYPNNSNTKIGPVYGREEAYKVINNCRLYLKDTNKTLSK